MGKISWEDYSPFLDAVETLQRNWEFLDKGRGLKEDEAASLAAIATLERLTKKVYGKYASPESEDTRFDKAST